MSTTNHCHFFDVGGDDWKLAPKLRELIKLECQSKEISVFLSHFDKDHIIKIFDLSKRFHISQVYLPYLSPHSHTGIDMFKKLHEENIKIFTLKPGEVKEGNDFHITCLAPLHASGQQPENSNSLVLRLKVGPSTILITGDSPPKPQLLSQPVQILKVAHHGSRHNSSAEVLTHLHPQTCIVSSGVDNKYGHPHREVLEILAQENCAILRTDRLGTIEFEL